MRKYVNVVGIGQQRKGVSKSGNAYDFTPVVVTYEDSKYTGVRACELVVDTPELLRRSVVVGDTLDVFMHEDYRRNSMVLDGII